jgi:NAD(P)-dependent dehydrogenase (short-subunit alcohol dehydrogenase family)
MQVQGKVVVTGGANGIGKALAEIFHREGAAKIVVADLDCEGAQAVAAVIGGVAFKADVGNENDIRDVIEQTERPKIQIITAKGLRRLMPIRNPLRSRGRHRDFGPPW